MTVYVDQQAIANMAFQFPSAVAISGGTLSGVTVSIGGIDTGSGLKNAYNAANAAFSQANLAFVGPFPTIITVSGLQANNAILANSITANANVAVMGNVTITGPTGYFSAQTLLGITATGVTQGGAKPLVNQINIISTCAAGANSVILPIPPVGAELTIINRGATGVNIFPPVGHGIDSLGLNANTGCSTSGYYKLILANTNHWYTTSVGVITALQ